MKHGLKKRILSLVLCISMVLPMVAQPMPVYSVENEESIAPLTNPFTPETIIALPDGTTTKSQSYRIPSMVTLADGTIVAAADIRWNTTYDGGGLDTLVACSTDGGKTWSYNVANYLGDNGNQYNPQSTTFIDPNLLVAADGQTVYMLVDLYAYGVSLNGLWGEYSQPAADTGFDTNGNLKLSDDDHNNYNYYLKDGKIYDSSNNVVEGYEIDAYFNITYTTQNGEIKKSNLFFAESPFKVARTQYLYLTKSTDGGATWSEPNLLDVRAKAKVATTEKALLVSPGNSITTSSGIMVFPVYSYNGSAVSQQMAFIYSTDGGETWLRSDNFTGGATFSSEAAVVELENGNLRFFYRSDNNVLSYADFNLASGNWSAEVQTEVPTNSDTQLSAITYSKTMDGKQVILISCPTGPNGEGSNDNNGSARINGKIHVFVMEEDGTMTLKNTVNMFETLATEKLPNANGDFFTEGQGFFSYSSMTERADGSIAILYENSQSGWGAGEGYYFTITAKTYDQFELLGATAFEDGVREKVVLKSGVSSVTLYGDPQADMTDSMTVDASALDGVYYISDRYFDVATGTLLYQLTCCVGIGWPEEADGYFYIPANLVEQTDEGIAIPIVDFTNAAPLVRSASIPQPATYKLRSSARTLSLSKAASNTSSGLVLDKTVIDNGNGTYTVNLEAYTTGTVTVQQTTKPMDIVLVLDQSGSMAYCIGCGSDNENVSSGEYHATYDVSTDGIYYYQQSYGNYSRLYYCSTCSGWHTSQNHRGTKYTPKSSDDDWWNTQFYVECESRLDALKRAVQSFVDEVYKKAAGADGVNGTTDDIAHRIAIVGFASKSGYGNNTELLSISGNNSGTVGITYNSITTANYTNVLQNLAVSGSKTMLDNAINALAASGATEADLGMLMAENIFKNNSVDLSQRDRVTIMFTDGTPTTGSSYESGVANDAINTASKLKNTYGSTVYTVGVFDGADASSPSSLPANDNTGSNRENRYMHLVSSNYLNATSMTNTGALNPKVTGDNSYYLSASDSTALNDIFQAMSSQIGSTSMDLGMQTVVKDIVTPQFDLPQDVNSVTVKQVDCTSYNEDTGGAIWGSEIVLSSEETVQFDTSTNSVNVTGFDFKHNYVAENGRNEDDETKEGTFHGRKLVITFTIKPDPDFLGGDNVKTNDEKSGVYAPGEESAAGTFTPGYVDVPLKEISNAAQDKHIYLGNTTNLIGILNLHVAESQSGKDLQSIANGINNAYVDLVYTVTVNGGTVYTYTIEAGKAWNQGVWKQGDTVIDLSAVSVTENTDYSVTCVMTSENNYSNQKFTNAPANIFVYKPTITFQDSVQEYNKALNMGTDVNSFLNAHKVGVDWKHGETLSTQVAMEGDAPEITFEYAYADGVFNDFVMNSVNDVPVNVTATIQGTGTAIGNNEGVTYKHQNCGGGVNCKYGMGYEEFIVHVINALTSLTIEKTGAADIDVNQSFLFTVTGKDADGKDINLTVTVHGNGSTIIDGLVIGNEYTITEKTDWSWRYRFSKWEHRVNADDATTTTTGSTNGAAIKLGENGTITFTNERKEVKWLDGDSWCNNIFNRIIKMFK